MPSRSTTFPDGKSRVVNFCEQPACSVRLCAAVRAVAETVCPERSKAESKGRQARPEGASTSSASLFTLSMNGFVGRDRSQHGFVLASAIFLLVIMAALAAFMVQVTVASQTASAQDIQGARAYQAARIGIEAGLYAVHVTGNCPVVSQTQTNIPGLAGFTVTWACTSYPFTESAVDKTIWQITSTACTTSGAGCPSATAAEVAGPDYVERQLVVVTEKVNE